MSGAISTFRSIWRFHRLLAGILVLEYAATFAIILSAASIAHTRAQTLAFDSGINENGLFVVRSQVLQTGMRPSDLGSTADAFRADIADVAMGSGVPFLGTGDETGSVGTGDDNKAQAAIYHGGADFVKTLGIHIKRGRSFLPAEVSINPSSEYRPSVVILSESLATRLFHAQSPLGQTISLNGSALVVVGVCAPLAGPQFRGRPETSYTLILPGIKADPTANLIILRTTNDVAALSHLLDRVNAATSGRIHWTLQSYARIRTNYFKADRAVALGLGVTVLAVVLTSLCGVLGLTRYWIGRRQTQIAVRLALGARRSDIVRHFLTESGLLVGCGLLLGCGVALAASRWTGLLYSDGLDPASLMVSLALTFGLSIVSVQVSLHRMLRLQPLELARGGGD